MSDLSLNTDEHQIVIVKDREVLEVYGEVLSGLSVRNILEFGIFQGGSQALFSLWLDVERVVGIDRCEPVTGFDAFRARHPIGQKIHCHYLASQTDQPKVEAIIRAEFGETRPDLIIDDASHLYQETRRTFEIAFPHLQPGGIYVVEDWGWAHWPGRVYFEGHSALSILIMELIMLCAARQDIISEVRVFPALTFVRKSPKAPDLSGMRLETLYAKRGLEIFETHHVNPTGMARLTGRHMVRTRVV